MFGDESLLLIVLVRPGLSGGESAGKGLCEIYADSGFKDGGLDRADEAEEDPRRLRLVPNES